MSLRGELSDVRQLLRQPALLFWCLYLVLIPFYVVKPGLPQPGDLLIVLLAPAAFIGWNGRISRVSRRVVGPLAWSTAWVCIVSVGWTFYLWSWGKDAIVPLFYIYNSLLFIIALVLYQRFRDKFLRLTVYAVYAIVIFQVVASFILRQQTSRGALFFSNPNQLGYFALLAACIIAVCQKPLKLPILWTSSGLTGCAYLALLSASRSALLGIAILFLLIVSTSPRVFILAALVATSLVFVGGPLDHALETAQHRIEENRRPEQGFLVSRGYDRIWNNPEYLIFGAAEGNTYRFENTTEIGKLEIHSSVGTLIFSYGVVGTALFGFFLFRLLQGTTRRTKFIIIGPLLHMVAHQGLRFSMLWILFAIIAALKSSNNEGSRLS